MSGLTPVSFKKGRGAQPRLSAPRLPGGKHERFWTDEEDRIVRETYPLKGAEATVAALSIAGSVHAARSQVYNRANTLKVRFVGVNSARKRREPVGIPADIDDRIRAGWPELKGRGAVDAFADRLGVPRWWLSKRAVKLALAQPHRKEPPWSEAESALMRQIPLHDPHRAAKIFREHGFKRTPTAIMVRAKRLDLSRRYNETLSARGVAEILGVDSKTVTSACISGALRAARRGTERLVQQGGDAWAVRHEDLRQYVLDNLEMIDIRKVEKFAFVALLTRQPPEESTHA